MSSLTENCIVVVTNFVNGACCYRGRDNEKKRMSVCVGEEERLRSPARIYNVLISYTSTIRISMNHDSL